MYKGVTMGFFQNAAEEWISAQPLELKNPYIYKLKKGDNVIDYKNKDLSMFFMILDSIDLPLEKIIANYDVSLDNDLYDRLKKMGY